MAKRTFIDASSSISSNLRTISKSKRGLYGLLINGMSSIGNFAVSLAIARSASVPELGAFALAFSLHVFFSGLVRATVSEPQFAHRVEKTGYQSAGRRASLIGMVAASVLLLFGLLLQLNYLSVMGISIHGLCIYDYVKTTNAVTLNRKLPILQEGIWLGISLAAGTLMVFGVVPPLAGFTIWAAGGAVLGYTFAYVERIGLAPLWRESTVPSKIALEFGADYTVGAGASQVSYSLIGALSGLDVLGALRAGSTLLGPINLVISTARTYAIPYLARGLKKGRRAGIIAAVSGALFVLGLTIPPIVVLLLAPDSLGYAVLGDNWAIATPVLPILALELIFISATTIPFAGFRALQAGRSSVIIRTSLAVIRLIAVAAAAFTSDAFIVATTLVALSCLSSVVWWIAFIVQVKKMRMRSDV